MVCEEALELLSGHLDGANTEEEEQRLRAHLETCAHCRELLAAFAAVDGAVADLEADPPPQLRQNIMAAVARERAQGPRRRRLAGLAVAAALVAVVGLGSLPFLGQEGDTADDAPLTAREAPVAAAAAPESVDAAAAPENFDAAVAPGVAPMMVEGTSALPELVVELLDDPAAPVAETIAALAQLPSQEMEDTGAVLYEADVETIRQIVADYGDSYEIAVPTALDRAADADPCGLLVVAAEP